MILMKTAKGKKKMLEEFYKYLDDFYKEELLENYDKEVIDSIDVNNGKKVLDLLEKNNFYFLEDVILNYIDIFMMDAADVEKGILRLKEKLGNNYLIKIGDDLSILDEIIKL